MLKLQLYQCPIISVSYPVSGIQRWNVAQSERVGKNKKGESEHPHLLTVFATHIFLHHPHNLNSWNRLSLSLPLVILVLETYFTLLCFKLMSVLMVIKDQVK